MKDPRYIDEGILRESVSRFRHYGAKRVRKHEKKLPFCNGKHSYKTFTGAAVIRAKRLKDGDATFLRIYQCPMCHYWHLTSLKTWKG